MGFSFVTIVLQILAPVFFPEKTHRGFTMMLCFILFLEGTPLLCWSIINSYLAHIYDEVKRPPYIVENVLHPRKKCGKEKMEWARILHHKQVSRS